LGIFTRALSVGASAASAISKDWIPYSAMHSWWGGQNARSGVEVSDRSASCSSANFACKRAISESLAILPRDMFRKKEEGRESVSGHPSLQVLKRSANPMLSSFLFFEMLQRHVFDAGGGYAEIQYNGVGDVIALWPLPPDRVKPVAVDRKGMLDVIYEITLSNSEKVTLTKDRVLHIPGVGFDGVRGYPMLDYMIHVLGLEHALGEYSASFFRNGAGLDGYVTVPDSFKEEQITNLQTHYRILNEGLDNAHRFKFLYESSKFTPSSATPMDSQMLESKIFQIQEIARFYRMPLHKIQETSKATGYNSLEQFNIEFVNDTLMPWILRWEQEIDRKFFDGGEDLYVKFNTNGLLRGDAKSRAEYYRTMVFTSLMTPNEARALEDFPPIKGGNERMIPLNMSIDGKVSGESERSMDSNERVQD